MDDVRVPPDIAISSVEVDRDAELGRGSDATVYVGSWHGAPVAVKVLHGNFVHTKSRGKGELVGRFLGECERLRHLRHPNIVQFLGVCRAFSNLPGLVTELMPTSLMARYEEEPLLTSGQELQLFKDTSAGLAYLHTLGIVHRDLTTRNVLVTGDGRAKIADVGVARSLHGRSPVEAPPSSMTHAPGTLLYMSPESLATPCIYDERLDVFSLGVLMIAVLLRREPSSGLLLSDRFEVTGGGNRRAIPEVQRRKDDLNDIGSRHILYSLIARCLSNEPSDRPRASDVHEELTGLYKRTGRDGRERSSKPRESCCSRCESLRVEVEQLREELARFKNHGSLQTKDRFESGEKQGHASQEFETEMCSREKDPVILSEQPESLQLEKLHTTCEWHEIDAPFAKSGMQRCAVRSAVHDETLYITNTVQTGRCAMHRSNDLKIWHSCPVPPGANLCTALLSYGNFLYAFWTNKGASDHGHPVLHRFRDGSWERLPNGRCPMKLLDPAAFQAKDSFILAGGWDGVTSTDTVLEYSVTRSNWVRESPWPRLPRVMHGLTAVETDRAVHLVGGSSCVNKQSKPNSVIFTLPTHKMRPLGVEWVCGELPSTPFSSCGACNVHGHLVIAGGFQQGKGIQDGVFTLDERIRQWLPLPSLSLARYYCMMAFFQRSLVVLGGRTASGLTGQAESISGLFPH